MALPPKAARRARLREVNDMVAMVGRALRDGGEGDEYEFLCECSDAACIETVRLTLDAYGESATRGKVLADGHQGRERSPHAPRYKPGLRE